MHPVIDSSLILAQAAAAAPGPAASIMTFLPIIFIVGAMYFLMIAPQRKKQKAMDAMLASLKTGDDVLTSGGIFGTITNVKDDRFVVRIAENVKVEVPRAFIHSVIAKKTEVEETK